MNGKDINLPKYAVVNGTLQSEYYEIEQNDVIEINNYYTVEQLRKFLELENSSLRLAVNHMPADSKTRVYENFSVEWGEAADEVYGEDTAAESWLTEAERLERAGRMQQPGMEPERASDGSGSAGVAFEEAEKEATKSEVQPEMMQSKPQYEAAQSKMQSETAQGKMQPAETKSVTVIVNGSPVTMTGKKSYIYVDVFDYIDFDLSTPHGSCVVTKRNGENAGYVDVLADGDQLEIYWEK